MINQEAFKIALINVFNLDINDPDTEYKVNQFIKVLNEDDKIRKGERN